LFKNHTHRSRDVFFSERVINVWNQLPEYTGFRSLSLPMRKVHSMDLSSICIYNCGITSCLLDRQFSDALLSSLLANKDDDDDDDNYDHVRGGMLRGESSTPGETDHPQTDANEHHGTCEGLTCLSRRHHAEKSRQR